MTGSPSAAALERLEDVHQAHALIREAWRHEPDHTLPGKGPDPGPTTGGGRSDPTARAAGRGDVQRGWVVAEVARLTIDLGQKLETLDGRERPSTVDFLTRRGRPAGSNLAASLALHRQWFEELTSTVCQLDTPTGYDDARELMVVVHHHASAMARASRWAHGHLVRPPAPDGLRVCDDDGCQDVLQDSDARFCRVCASRRERAAALRAAEVAREQARPLCAACGERLSVGDVDGGHQECQDCRTPRCGAEIRTDCTRPLTDDDIMRNATNCQPCRNWQSWQKRQERQDAIAS